VPLEKEAIDQHQQTGAALPHLDLRQLESRTLSFLASVEAILSL
jgi:hypothetical protein